MPRYFFHVYDRNSSLDQDGTELPNSKTMQTEAVHLVAGLLRDQGYGLTSISPLAVEVADENEVIVFRVEVGLIHPSRSQTDVPPRLAPSLQ